MESLSQVMASPFAEIAVVLGLAFLMGLEREERKLEPGTHVAAGVRTFPLIALLGYMLTVAAPDSVVPVTAGLLAVAAFLVVFYQHKQREGTHGFTSELAALVAYALGALVARHEYWIAVTVAVTDVLLLSGKPALQGLARRLDQTELITFVKFLLLSAVILPILPNQDFTRFALNPLKTWLVVVAVCGISYASFLLQRALKSSDSVILSAVLGGVYSSTLATVALARQSRGQERARLYSGAIILSSAVMYLRVAALVAIFNRALGAQLWPALVGLGALTAAVAALIMASGREPEAAPVSGVATSRNPLELTIAVTFGAVFVLLTVVTKLVAGTLGNAGVYGLAAVMGVADTDPFIMGLAQTAGAGTELPVAALGIAIAVAGNNVMKGVYAASLGGWKLGAPVLVTLTATGAIGVALVALIAG